MDIKELEEKIKSANHSYWDLNEPIISDFEYDALVEELRKLDPQNDLVNSVESSKIIGEKVIHSKPMLSLDKVYSFEDLKKWIDSKARSFGEIFSIQPKYDGISGKLENGILTTRGDGHEGTNITSRLPLIDIETNKTDKGYVLGEILIKNSSFKKDFPNYVSKSGRPFKNQRNGVAGLMGCDDVDFYVKQGLKVTLVDYDKTSIDVQYCDFDEENWNRIKSLIEKLDYPMDGIVIKIKDKAYFDALGCTEHHPRGAVAFKFTNKTRISKITGIEITQGKECLSAVANVEPVDFDGVTVSNVKIPMTKPVERDLPCVINGEIAIGDIIEIERSGDVIPNVVSIAPGEHRQIFKLDKCPFCGSELFIESTSVKCSNQNCFEKKLRKLDFSLNAIGFIGIGRTNLRKIMKKTGIEDIGQFMDLTMEDIEQTGVGPGNAENIFTEKERCRGNRPEIVLVALNIPSLGNTVAKNLLKSYSLDRISDGLTYDELIAVPGIGEVTAKDISLYVPLKTEWIKSIISKFNFEDKKEETGKNGTICFTGKSTRPRYDMESCARLKGFAPVGSITKDLTVLVCADVSSNSSKAQKARKLGVKIISEEDFWKIENE